MAKFEVVSKYITDGNTDIETPKRSTAASAGYDFAAAEDTIIPPYGSMTEVLARSILAKLQAESNGEVDENGAPKIDIHPLTIDELGQITKQLGLKPTLIPTGIKCQLADNEFLQLAVRSSCPLKYWIVLANGVGVIDADYYNNEDNEGEIFFQVINLSPIAIELKKGDKIGQGMILNYLTTEDDAAAGKRNGGFGSTDENIGA